MKKVIFTLAALASLSSFATDCPSVDLAVLNHEVGGSHIEVIEAIECKLQNVYPKQATCNTRIGIKKDKLRQLELAYANAGLASLAEIKEARIELSETVAACNQ